MKILKYWFWETPEKVNQPIVVIDAFAATTNLVIMLSKKPKRIILTNEDNYQQALKIYPKSVLIGESRILPASVFETGNPPSDIYKLDLKGKSIIYMSENGTRVLEKFKKHKNIIAAAFVNIKKVVDYLKRFPKATIIMAGDQAFNKKVLEDSVCADLIIKGVNGRGYDWQSLKKRLVSFIRNYYQWVPEKEKASLTLVLAESNYEIIPAGIINKEGFMEIKNLPL